MRALALLVPVVLALPGLVGCSADETDGSGFSPTSLSDFDPTAAAIARAPFCDRFADGAVEASVGEVAGTGHYGNGATADLTDEVRDVSHELNCTFTGSDGRVARAWVFVPEVPPVRAKQLAAGFGDEESGCSAVAVEGFGSPAAGEVCRTGDAIRVRYAGLFVDAWLSCSLTTPASDPAPDVAELREAAGEWCVEAARAASDRPEPG